MNENENVTTFCKHAFLLSILHEEKNLYHDNSNHYWPGQKQVCTNLTLLTVRHHIFGTGFVM